MATSLSPATVPQTPDAGAEMSPAEKRRRWFEVFLVLLISCGPAIASSLYLFKNGPVAMPTVSNGRWIFGMVEESGALLLLGYVLSRRGWTFANLGFRWSIKDCGVGLLLAGASFVAYVIGNMIVQVAHYRIYGSFSTGHTGADFFGHPPMAMIPFSLLNPFFEELIVRAYLMTEVSELTGSAFWAVAVSVAVQFSYHLYYGWTGALTLSFLFLAFALYYVRARRALPIIVAHGFFDLYALIRLW